VAFISFFIYGQQDANELQNRDEIVQNWLKFGAFLAHILIYKGFGVAAL
jgi:S-DNA-T family DNA segregation ATPase FtsK/SpoIIIE